MSTDMSKKIKDFLRSMKTADAKPTFGTNPMDPWSTKANLDEWANVMHPALQKYLKSKGLDPRYVSRNQMISHSKTGDFTKWKKDHYDKAKGYSEEVDLGESEEHLKSPTAARRNKIQSRITKNSEISNVTVPIGEVKEEKYHDSCAATQTYSMEVESNKSKLSKSARMIKSLYKYHRMQKEDMTDWEKEDKSVATYGKKPKFDKTDEKDSLGENKPKARAILSGGTTLTGEKRDVVEFDPEMRSRSNTPDATDKDKKKDDKSKDKTSTK